MHVYILYEWIYLCIYIKHKHIYIRAAIKNDNLYSYIGEPTLKEEKATAIIQTLNLGAAATAGSPGPPSLQTINDRVCSNNTLVCKEHKRSLSLEWLFA